MSNFKIGDEVVVKSVRDENKVSLLGNIEVISEITECGYILEGFYNNQPIYWNDDELKIATIEDKLNAETRHINRRLHKLEKMNYKAEYDIGMIKGESEEQEKHIFRLLMAIIVISLFTIANTIIRL